MTRILRAGERLQLQRAAARDTAFLILVPNMDSASSGEWTTDYLA
jgi:hypothetical protein